MAYLTLRQRAVSTSLMSQFVLCSADMLCMNNWNAFCLTVYYPELRNKNRIFLIQNQNVSWTLLTHYSSMLPSSYLKRIYFLYFLKLWYSWCIMFCKLQVCCMVIHSVERFYSIYSYYKVFAIFPMLSLKEIWTYQELLLSV